MQQPGEFASGTGCAVSLRMIRQSTLTRGAREEVSCLPCASGSRSQWRPIVVGLTNHPPSVRATTSAQRRGRPNPRPSPAPRGGARKARCGGLAPIDPHGWRGRRMKQARLRVKTYRSRKAGGIRQSSCRREDECEVRADRPAWPDWAGIIRTIGKNRRPQPSKSVKWEEPI